MATGNLTTTGMCLRILIPSLCIKLHLRYISVQLCFASLCQQGFSPVNIHLAERPQSPIGQRFSGNQPSPGWLYPVRFKHTSSSICSSHRTREERQASTGKGSCRVPGTANSPRFTHGHLHSTTMTALSYHFLSVQQN